MCNRQDVESADVIRKETIKDDFDNMMRRAITKAIIDEYAWGVRSVSDIAHSFNVPKEKVEEIILTFKARNQKEVSE